MSASRLSRLPAWLLALGRCTLPKIITTDQGHFQLQEVFKHDFWAASGLYVGQNGKVVLKIYRRQDLMGLHGLARQSLGRQGSGFLSTA